MCDRSWLDVWPEMDFDFIYCLLNYVLVLASVFPGPCRSAVLPESLVPSSTVPPEAKVNCTRSSMSRVDPASIDMLNTPVKNDKLNSKLAGPVGNNIDKYGLKTIRSLPNCSSTDSEVSVVYQDNLHQWKTKIIISCTIAAAVEVVIVLFIIMYWREIRWTMRKLACPCTQRRRDRANHEAMSEDPISDDRHGNQDDLEADETGYLVRMYSPADSSHHSHDDEPEAGSSSYPSRLYALANQDEAHIYCLDDHRMGGDPGSHTEEIIHSTDV